LQADEYHHPKKKVGVKDFHEILGLCQLHFEANLPFVLYAKPDISSLISLFQRNCELFQTDNFTESGFVMAPFNGRAMMIPENAADLYSADFILDNVVASGSFLASSDSKDVFENLVRKGKAAILNGEFAKVVLSRTEVVELTGFDFISIFKNILCSYPSAFRYCFFHPKIGFWMGATPEKLLEVYGNIFRTVALAGTKKFVDSADVEWGEKEKQEQYFVTKFIIDGLQTTVKNLKTSEPYTAKAGNLLHIKTDIEGELDDRSKLEEVLRILHPTPAVCGYPKIPARKFIIANEGYDREFYSGFLGEINMNGSQAADLYVNLRCMKIKDDSSHLFVGCGITKDSDPELEFIETVNKSMTMKKILL
jgi:isochorismate synthase